MHPDRTPVGGVVVPSRFEALLEDLNAAIIAGDDASARDLRTSIESDLAARERGLGIGGTRA